MRKVVLLMMTTLNGRLDDPGAWVHGISDDILAENARILQTFDTMLIGEATYHEMVQFWPGAETDPDEPASIREIAKAMNTSKKYVFSKTKESISPDWNNTELVKIDKEKDLKRFIEVLIAQPGKDICLSGGAMLAQSIIRFGLVDDFYLIINPVVSPGKLWFDNIAHQIDFSILETKSFENGAMRVHFVPSTEIKHKDWWDPNTEHRKP